MQGGISRQQERAPANGIWEGWFSLPFCKTMPSENTFEIHCRHHVVALKQLHWNGNKTGLAKLNLLHRHNLQSSLVAMNTQQKRLLKINYKQTNTSAALLQEPPVLPNPWDSHAQLLRETPARRKSSRNAMGISCKQTVLGYFVAVTWLRFHLFHPSCESAGHAPITGGNCSTWRANRATGEVGNGSLLGWQWLDSTTLGGFSNLNDPISVSPTPGNQESPHLQTPTDTGHQEHLIPLFFLHHWFTLCLWKHRAQIPPPPLGGFQPPSLWLEKISKTITSNLWPNIKPKRIKQVWRIRIFPIVIFSDQRNEIFTNRGINTFCRVFKTVTRTGESFRLSKN